MRPHPEEVQRRSRGGWLAGRSIPFGLAHSLVSTGVYKEPRFLDMAPALRMHLDFSERQPKNKTGELCSDPA